jgi:hypothetical protein
MSVSAKANFCEVLARFENHQFTVDDDSFQTSEEVNMAVYNIDYYGWGLNLIEHFCEGEFVLAQRIKFRRYYKLCTTTTTYTDLPIHLTEVLDISQ